MSQLLLLLKSVGIAIAILLVNSPTAQAQTRSVVDLPPPPSLWETPIPSFNFPGGTLSNFAKQLQPLVPAIDKVEISQGQNSILPPFKQGKTTLAALTQRLQLFAPRGCRIFVSAKSEVTDDGAKTVLSFGTIQDVSLPQDGYLGNFSFPGGSVADLANQIRSQNLGWKTIYFPPEVADRPIPAFNVGSILFKALPDIVGVVTDYKCRIDWRGEFLKIEYRNPTSMLTTILPLRDVLKDYRIEDINALVQTALKMKNTGDGKTRKNPDMSFHRETQTLIVVGEPDQVDVVNSVIKALSAQREKEASTQSPSSAKINQSVN